MTLDIDMDSRERDFVRTVPLLRRFASRLLPSVLEVEGVIMEVHDVWTRTEGYFDAPIRHLLRLVAQRCIERQRALTRVMPDSTEEESAVLAIADVAEVSLLIAVNRLPRRAREAFIASVLGRAIPPDSQEAEVIDYARQEVRKARPHLESLQLTAFLPTVREAEDRSILAIDQT